MVAMLAIMSGCGQTGPAPTQAQKQTDAHDGHDHDAVAASSAADDHSGWWCSEHGVPEEICARCDSKVAAEFQKKGDWCKQHDRPESQCFICHPELLTKFAAQYEAKFGKKPPTPDEG
jgi:hypothetical protein